MANFKLVPPADIEDLPTSKTTSGTFDDARISESSVTQHEAAIDATNLTNGPAEANATADQTDAEIETAYNNQVDVVLQAEAEAGTATTVRRWTAQRIAQAIAALASGSGDVTGPGSATDNSAARFDSTTGKVIQGSALEIDDTGNMSVTGGAFFMDGPYTAAGFSKTTAFSDVNYVQFRSNSTGNEPELQGTGTDTNIGVNIVPKGSGEVQADGEKIIDETDAASIAETDTGTDTTKYVTPDGLQGSKRNIRYMCFHLVDSATDVAADTSIGGDFTIPFSGTILQDDTLHDQLAATTDTAGTTGTMVVDVHLNGTTIMTTNKLDIETTEKGTQTAATQPDLTTTSVSAGDILTFDIDAVHTTAAKGLKVYMAIRED